MAFNWRFNTRRCYLHLFPVCQSKMRLYLIRQMWVDYLERKSMNDARMQQKPLQRIAYISVWWTSAHCKSFNSIRDLVAINRHDVPFNILFFFFFFAILAINEFVLRFSCVLCIRMMIPKFNLIIFDWIFLLVRESPLHWFHYSDGYRWIEKSMSILITK